MITGAMKNLRGDKFFRCYQSGVIVFQRGNRTVEIIDPFDKFPPGLIQISLDEYASEWRRFMSENYTVENKLEVCDDSEKKIAA